VFREVIGQSPARFEPLWDDAARWLSAPTSCVARSLSPHAPYTTAAEVYSRAARAASSAPIATHWLETREEREFLAAGRGPLAEFLTTLGAWSPDRRPLGDPWKACLAPSLSTQVRWLLVHANYLEASDLEVFEKPDWRAYIAGVVYCPRTHAYFGHPTHPWRELQRRGVPVALGTDSLASNPDLSVYEEARYLATKADGPSPEELLAMLTVEGAQALGLKESGRGLTEGGPATWTVVRPGAGAAEDIAPDAEVVGTMIDGSWRHGPAELPAKQM
jgi:cytosine/adenosine deaminase-related metal-dependent hydrolase